MKKLILIFTIILALYLGVLIINHSNANQRTEEPIAENETATETEDGEYHISDNETDNTTVQNEEEQEEEKQYNHEVAQERPQITYLEPNEEENFIRLDTVYEGEGSENIESKFFYLEDENYDEILQAAFDYGNSSPNSFVLEVVQNSDGAVAGIDCIILKGAD